MSRETVDKLQQKRSSILGKIREIAELAVKSESGSFSEEQLAEVKRLKDEEKSLRELELTLCDPEMQADYQARANNQQPAGQPVSRPSGDDPISAKKMEEMKREAKQALDDSPKPFDSLGEQLRAIMRPQSDEQVNKLRVINERAAATGMSMGVDAEGGHFIQADFATSMIREAYDTGIFARECFKVPLAQGKSGIKIPLLVDSDRTKGARLGGIRVYPIAEAEAYTASKVKIEKLEVDIHKIGGAAYVTDELMENFSAMDIILRQAFAEEFGLAFDEYIFEGLGHNTPLGIMKSNALISVAKEGSQAADSIVTENIVKMRSRLFARSRPKAKWYINQDTEPALHLMTVAVGSGGGPVYLPANGLAGAPYDRLYGMDVVPHELCETLGDQGDINLFDLSKYLLLEREGGSKGQVSIHVRFLYDEQVLKITTFIGGKPIHASAQTQAKSAKTLSGFVTLDARA